MKNWREQHKAPMQEMLREIEKRHKGGFRLGPYEVLIIEMVKQLDSEPEIIGFRTAKATNETK